MKRFPGMGWGRPPHLANLISIGLAFLVVGCGSSTGPATLAPMTIGVFNGPYPLQLAVNKGYFGSLKVTTVVQDSGPAALPLMVAGQLQGSAEISQPPVDIAFDKGIAVRVVWIDDESPDNLIARPQSGITDARSLKGKKIGLPGGSLSESLLSAYLQTAGLTLSDIQLADLAPENLPSAFSAGAVDAVWAAEPQADAIAKAGGKVIVEHYDFNFTIVPKSFIDQHADSVQQFVCGLYKAHVRFFANQESTYQELATLAGMSVDSAKASLVNMAPADQATAHYLGTTTGTPSDRAQVFVDYGAWLVSQGKATRAPTLQQAQGFFDPSFAAKASSGGC